jgi:hypothetical protein
MRSRGDDMTDEVVAAHRGADGPALVADAWVGDVFGSGEFSTAWACSDHDFQVTLLLEWLWEQRQEVDEDELARRGEQVLSDEAVWRRFAHAHVTRWRAHSPTWISRTSVSGRCPRWSALISRS